MHTDHKCLVSGSIGGISAQSHIVHHFMILWMHIQAYTPCIHGSLHVFKSTSRGSTRPTVKIISHQLFFLLISRYHLLHRNATDINCKIWMDSWIYSLQASPSNSTDHNGKSTGKPWFYPKLEPRSRNPSMSMQMISLATKVLISPTQNLYQERPDTALAHAVNGLGLMLWLRQFFQWPSPKSWVSSPGLILDDLGASPF